MSDQLEVNEDVTEAGPSQPGLAVTVATGMGLLLLIIVVGTVAQPFVHQHAAVFGAAAGVLLLLGYLAGIITNAVLRARWARRHAAPEPEVAIAQLAAARFEKFVFPIFAVAVSLPLIVLPLVHVHVPKPEQHGWEVGTLLVSLALIVVGLIVRSAISPRDTGGDNGPGASGGSSLRNVKQLEPGQPVRMEYTPAQRAENLSWGVAVFVLVIAVAGCVLALVLINNSDLAPTAKTVWEATAFLLTFAVIGVSFVAALIAEAIAKRRLGVVPEKRTVIDKPVMS